MVENRGGEASGGGEKRREGRGQRKGKENGEEGKEGGKQRKGKERKKETGK